MSIDNLSKQTILILGCLLGTFAAQCVMAIDATSSATGGEGAGDALQEITVTAQKRSERIQDVPISVSAISGDSLESMHINTLADLSSYVPGMNVNSGGSPGYRTIVLRGLSDGYGGDLSGPLVGTYIDDVPLGSSTSSGRGNLFGLDMMPYDIDGVEVLKGPQGTLYGGNTMGGLVKYTLLKPNLTEFEARVGGDVNYVNDSGEPGWNTRGAINVPIITDQLAARVSVYHQANAGFIDNIGIGEKDSNHSTQNGGRASLLWQPNDRLSVQATVLAQEINVNDQTIVMVDPITYKPVYGPQTSNTNFAEPYKQNMRFYSLKADWNTDFADFVNTAAYSRINGTLGEDVPSFGPYTGIPDALAFFWVNDFSNKFVDEARIVSPSNQRIQWMVGGYFTKEDTGENDSIPTFTASRTPLPITDNLLINSTTGSYKEIAGFGNITIKLSDRFDITGGERYSAYSQSTCPGTDYGLLGGGSYSPCTSLPSTGVSTWMADGRFHLDPDNMVYVRVATGYRPGQGCPSCANPLVPQAPAIVNPDRTTNYELGFKGSMLEHRLQLNVALFDIEWKDIQIDELITVGPEAGQGSDFLGNGGTARSNGLEVEAAYEVVKGLRFDSTLAYTHAYLTEDVPGTGNAGDRLPVSARWTGSFTADYTTPLEGSTSLQLGGSYRYRDKIYNQFEQTGQTAPMGPQNIVDLYTGVAIDKLTLRLTGRNVFNDRSYAGLMFLGATDQLKYVPVQPRTIGISADYRF